MTTTPNRHYSLPSRHHDVVDDINDLRTTFGKVDEDIVDIENAVTELSDDVSDAQATVIHTDSALENTEIQNIAPNRYLVVNRTGDGFECLDGGGDAGGETGQCSIKKSDQEFDTAWGNISEVSKNGMTIKENEETSESGEIHIFVDENEEEIDNDKQFPKVELTNCQTKSDIESDSNSSVIICDTIEEVKEEIQTATNLNYGFIKVGNGLSVDNGTLSAPVYSAATVDDFGLIKTGSGLNNNDGVISYDAISPATLSSFGVVKLGENLKINTNGEMEIDDMGTSATIYDLGNVKVCNNGIVELEEATLRYRLFVTEDLMIQFSMDFEPRDDFSFVLDLVSDGTHLVAFDDELYPEMTTLPINRGITKITFTKKLGVPSYNFEISRLDAPNPINLTPSRSYIIDSEFTITSPQGGDRNPALLLRTTADGYSNIRELQFDFETLVCVDYVNYISQSSSAVMGEFILKGSNDGKNWTTLLYRNGEVVYGKVYTDIKGCFRHYNLKIGYTSDNTKSGGVTLWGTKIDNNESELISLTPLMSSNSTTFATFTASKISSNSATQITDDSLGTYITIGYDANQNRWAQYELTTPDVANVLELGFYNTDTQTNWFTLTGSNDGENWTLLLERQYAGKALSSNGYRAMIYNLQNETAYKYYRLNCIATNDTAENWLIYGFKLYRRDIGKHNLYNLVPTLSSNSQDGYEVATSSNYNDSLLPFYVFDNNASTKWGTKAPENNNPEWLQIKLPTANICNVVTISARPEGDNIYKETPTEFDIQGSNDGESWDILTSQTGVSWSSNGQTQSFSFENETAYLYYRILMKENTYIASGTNKPYSFGEIMFGHKIREYKRYLDKSEYLVPKMSSNSQNGYVASAISQIYDYAPWKAFDRTATAESDCWLSSTDQASDSEGYTNGWIQIKLPEAKVANNVNFVCRNGPNLDTSKTSARNWTLKGSNDGANWTTLLTVTDQIPESIAQSFSYSFENTTAYLYYKVDVTRVGYGGAKIAIGQLNLIYKELITEY